MDPSNYWPRTLEAAVARLIAQLSDTAKEQLRSMAEDDLIQTHFGLGLCVRNNFGLWGGNYELLDSCAPRLGREGWMHPDTASGVIIHGVCQALRAGEDDEVNS